jgi:hypothetical protein
VAGPSLEKLRQINQAHFAPTELERLANRFTINISSLRDFGEYHDLPWI